MMKTKKNTPIFGIFAVLAVFGLVFAACPQPTDDPPPLAAVTPPPPALSEEATFAFEDNELTATYDGDEEVSYQWYKDGVAIEGATDATYIPTADGSYTVTVSAEGYASQTSDPIVVTLETLEGELNVSPNTDVTTGMELTATYTGSESISYQWKKGETNVGTNSNKFTPTEYGIYTVTVSKVGYNSKTSDPVTIIGILAGDVSITPSTEVTTYMELTATYDGSEEVSYQWNKDGVAIDGATTDKFTPTEANSYTVTVSATNYNSKTSDPVTISLSSLPGEINITPSGEVPIGTQLTANYTGSEVVNYQWKKDGANVGTNSNKFTSTEAGSYTVTVSSAGYTEKTSGAVTVALIFIDIPSLVEYLDTLPLNTAATPHTVKLNVNALPSGVNNSSYYSALQKALMVTNKYVSLDLSGSTFTSIPNYVFYGCASLTSVTLPNTLTSIGQYSTFEGCASLTSVILPNTLTSIGQYYTFKGCTSLTSIIIPNGVTIIGTSAFYNCSSLTSVTIPASVTSIKGQAFEGCANLTSVTIPNGITHIEGGLFSGCTRLASVNIPDSVTDIDYRAFYNCAYLTNIAIPDSVISIGEQAFYGCVRLASVILPNGVQEILTSTFEGCTSLTSVTLPTGLYKIRESAFYGCANLTSITIPYYVNTIERYAFFGCTRLTSVTFESSNIVSRDFSSTTAFYGDLRAMYLSYGSGTYKTTATVSSSSVWTKQP